MCPFHVGLDHNKDSRTSSEFPHDERVAAVEESTVATGLKGCVEARSSPRSRDLTYP